MLHGLYTSLKNLLTFSNDFSILQVLKSGRLDWLPVAVRFTELRIPIVRAIKGYLYGSRRGA